MHGGQELKEIGLGREARAAIGRLAAEVRAPPSRGARHWRASKRANPPLDSAVAQDGVLFLGRSVCQ